MFLLIRIKPFISMILTIANYVMESALSIVFLLYTILGYDMSQGNKIPPAFKEQICDLLVWMIVLVVIVALITMIYMVVMKIWFTLKKCIDSSKLKEQVPEHGED